MSERSPHPQGHEHHKPKHSVEHQPTVEHHKPHHEKEHKHEAKEHAPLPELKNRAKEEAIASKEAVGTEKETPQAHTDYVSRELKKQTLQRTMTRVRKQLSAPGRTFSKVIHQPVVDVVSQASSKTVARPSGLLGGSIVAFVGSSAFLWMARYYGFQYNFLLFAMLFVGGFALGMIIELLLFAVRRKKT